MTKIGIISTYDPHSDRKAHSGILFKINESLKNAGCETFWIKNPESKMYRFLARCATLLSLFCKKQIYIDRTYLGSYLRARTINQSDLGNYDYIIIIHYFHAAYWLRTNTPIIYHSDATFDIVNNYYLQNMWKWNEKQAEKIEIGALNKCILHLSSSDWRNKSLINHYKINADNCKVLEYGPCIETNKQHNRSHKDNNSIQLLFFGVEWIRKGGHIAVDTCRTLNSMNYNSKIKILGIRQLPNTYKDERNLEFIGYLDKNSPVEYQKLIEILQNTDFLILPTKAECSAVVYSECSSMGIPIITYDTGGVGNYVINGKNGYRLPINATGYDFATKIIEIINKGEWDTLSSGGIIHYQNKLNWSCWTSFFREYFNNNCNE